MAAYGAWNAAIRLALRGYVLNRLDAGLRAYAARVRLCSHRLTPVCEHTPHVFIGRAVWQKNKNSMASMGFKPILGVVLGR